MLSRLCEEDMVPRFVSDFECKFYPTHPVAKSYVLGSIDRERMLHNTIIKTMMTDEIYLEYAPLFASRNIVATVTDKKTEGFVIGDTGAIRFPKAVHDLRHPITRFFVPFRGISY